MFGDQIEYNSKTMETSRINVAKCYSNVALTWAFKETFASTEPSDDKYIFSRLTCGVTKRSNCFDYQFPINIYCLKKAKALIY